MKGSRWAVVAAAMALVVSASPAIGAGKDASGSLAWAQGGVTIRSYAFPTVDSGSRASTKFKLSNRGRSRSGKFAIRLTGSSAFSIGSTGCTGKSLGARKWCHVIVAYAPSQAGATDRAVLTATREHKTAARLKISGCSADPSSHVYWVTDPYESGGSVMEGVSAAGCPSTITTLASGQSCTDPPAVDGTHVYWANYCDGTVRSVPRSGGKVTALASGQHYPVSLAVDGTNVYWVNRFTGTVNAVPLGGGTVTTLASSQDPTSVATDGTNVYWTDAGSDGLWSTDATVNAVPIGGGSVTTLASGLHYSTSVTVVGTHVYWLELGDVNEVPVGGGSVTTVLSGEGPNSFAVDGTNVYWTTEEGTVNKVPLGGGSVTTLASGQGTPYYAPPFSVVVHGAHVYWAGSASSFDTSDGAVKEVSVDGGNVNVVARQVNPGGVAVP